MRTIWRMLAALLAVPLAAVTLAAGPTPASAVTCGIDMPCVETDGPKCFEQGPDRPVRETICPIPLRLPTGTGTSSTLTVSPRNGTALLWWDYTGSFGSLPLGAAITTGTYWLPVHIIADGVTEPEENFLVDYFVTTGGVTTGWTVRVTIDDVSS